MEHVSFLVLLAPGMGLAGELIPGAALFSCILGLRLDALCVSVSGLDSLAKAVILLFF